MHNENMDLISLHNFLETMLIINSSMAEMLAIKQTKIVVVYNPNPIYINGKQNKTIPVNLLA
ncbi:hypothetical protein [Clostridium sp. JS66]|uniref:hypothetical protein n=1 Tax=Clostridium sp. JS66 TaxID=3064705 RepID=UPI00298DECF7|nr:hypothetical protein [Clostridium sp. JS66]WPC41147.1 hypothetical protein Q6H37_25145 [Clostridium sp. JS66]